MLSERFMSRQRRIYYFRLFVPRGELQFWGKEFWFSRKELCRSSPKVKIPFYFINALGDDDRHDNFDRRSF